MIVSIKKRRLRCVLMKSKELGVIPIKNDTILKLLLEDYKKK